ncbi:MAG: bactofilin family protein [Syntrophomonadaceae bacterium]
MIKKNNGSYQGIESLIPSGVEIKGDIIAQGSIRLDGILEGTLNIKGDLVLGKNGHIKGQVFATNIIVAGTIEGHITAQGRVELTSTGAMIGDIITNTITIEEGGMLEGTSKMIREKPTQEQS